LESESGDTIHLPFCENRTHRGENDAHLPAAVRYVSLNPGARGLAIVAALDHVQRLIGKKVATEPRHHLASQ
jgi:hypothetical protein